MKHVVLSVRDRASEMFSRPMVFPTAGVAVRALTDEVNRAAPDNDYFKHPSDFKLYELATFDDETGLITAFDSPNFVVALETLKKEDGNV